MIVELLRQPMYLVSTMAFPALFYLIFAVPESTSRQAANMMMASFTAFAVFGVIFLQFGIGLAQERSQTWFIFLKTLPSPNGCLLTARFLSAIFFAALTAGLLIVLALVLTPVQLEVQAWSRFLLGIFGGAVAFCSFGAALGYWSNEKTSLPLGNLIYLPLTFAGGLWKPPSLLPESLQEISNHLPTRFFGEILWSAVENSDLQNRYVWGLTFYSFLGLLLAYWGHLRDGGAVGFKLKWKLGGSLCKKL